MDSEEKQSKLSHPTQYISSLDQPSQAPHLTRENHHKTQFPVYNNSPNTPQPQNPQNFTYTLKIIIYITRNAQKGTTTISPHRLPRLPPGQSPPSALLRRSLIHYVISTSPLLPQGQITIPSTPAGITISISPYMYTLTIQILHTIRNIQETTLTRPVTDSYHDIT